MPTPTPYIKFDRRGPALVENTTTNGLTIERGLQIFDFPVANLSVSAKSDPYTLLRCLSMVGTGPGDYVTRFPQLLDGYPPPTYSGDFDFSFCTVIGQRLTGIDSTQRALNAVVRYHSPIGPQSPGVITYTVNRRTQQSFVKNYTTADGSEVLSAWYQAGLDVADQMQHWNAPTSPNDAAGGGAPIAAVLPAPANKMLTSRVIEVVGVTTKGNWDSVKGTFDAAAGKINSDTAGVWAPRGTWLYLGPDVSYNNAGTIGTITHRLVEGVGWARWFPLLPFYDNHGIHPADSAPESFLETATDSPGFPPPVGTQIRICGLTMASVQLETGFSSLFPGLAP